jgi:hypothetical protein
VHLFPQLLLKVLEVIGVDKHPAVTKKQDSKILSILCKVNLEEIENSKTSRADEHKAAASTKSQPSLRCYKLKPLSRRYGTPSP